MSAVPTVYGALAAGPGRRRHQHACACPIVGASPLPAVGARGLRARTPGVRLLEGYGLTEATCASACTPPGERTRRVGRPASCPSQQMKAVRDRRRRLLDRLRARARSGVLVIGGPDRVRRLRHRPRRSAAPGSAATGMVRDGWLDTGDLGSVDADGFVYLTGRAKDLIIRGGHNIDPAGHRGRAAAPTPRSPPPRRSAAPTGTPARSRSPTSSRPTPAGSTRPSCWPGPRDAIDERRRPAEAHLPDDRDPGHRGRQALQARAGRRRRRPRRHRGADRGGPCPTPEVTAAHEDGTAGRHRDRRRPRPRPRRRRRVRPHRPLRAVAAEPRPPRTDPQQGTRP